MIKFFRHIRQSFLEQNKTGKYLKYAIGEIVLVVIGILIALQINIWNEQRKTEGKIKAILKEVQKDLEADILKSKELFKFYAESDSIIQLAINNKLKREDYEANKGFLLIFVGMNAYHLKIHSNGYHSLMANLDDIPEKFREVIEPLNEIYIYNKYEIDKFDERIDKVTDRLMDDLSANQPWFYEIDQNKMSDSLIAYYLNDPFYKNALSVFTYAANNLRNHLDTFGNNSIRAYHKIAKLSGYPKEFPDYFPHHLITLTPQLIEEVEGDYRLIKVTDQTGVTQDFDYPYKIEFKEDRLFFVDLTFHIEYDLFFKNDTVLYGNNYEAELIKDDDNKVTGIKVVYLKDQSEFKKVAK